MSRIINSGVMLAIAASATIISSCSSEENVYNENYKQEQYAQNWEATFGEIDPNQDWNMATQVATEFDLAETYNVRIYTANPANPDAKLLAKTTSTATSFKFDAPKGLGMVYVLAECDNDTPIRSYMEIVDGTLTISEKTAAGAKALTRATGTCNTTIGETIDYGTFWNSYSTPAGNMSRGSVTYLNNVNKETFNGWTLEDLLPLVGNTGYFKENVNNKQLYKDKFGTRIEYTTTKEGPIDVANMFGGTDYYNEFGYFYYSADATLEDKINATKYIIMDDARPKTNLTLGGEAVTGMSLPHTISAVQAEYWNGTPALSTIVTGTRYSLVYFDENGNASYNFPAGIKIAFFINMLANNENPTDDYLEEKRKEGYNVKFSIPEMNAYYGKYEDYNNLSSGGEYEGVTYKYGNQIIIGFEDGYDKDLNDIMWVVEGDFEEDIPDIDPDKPVVDEPMIWTVACEDLGTTDDIDFNDIVFRVSHVSGVDTVKFIPMAAGGIYKSTVYFDYGSGKTEVGEIHRLIDETIPEATENGSYPMLNTSTKGAVGDTITYAGASADFTMTDLSGVSIIVEGQGDATEITAPPVGEAPQMILIDGEWAWPTERTHIETAYPDFGEWSKEAGTNLNWDDDCQGPVINQ